MPLFKSEIDRFKWRHPIAWRRAQREVELESKLYPAIAETLELMGIPDECGPEGEDEPSYDILVAVMRVLRREKVKL